MANTKKEPLTTDVKKCARCDKDHAGLVFTELNNPQDGFGMWAACPDNGQPILLRAVPSGEGIKKEKNRHAEEAKDAKFTDVSRQDFDAFVSNYNGVLRAERTVGEPPVSLYRDPIKASKLIAKIVFNELMDGHPDYVGKANEYRIYE